MPQTRVLYQSDAGGVYTMRVSSEKLNTLAPATGLVATDAAVEVKISKRRRAYGIRPRGVNYSILLTTTTGDTFRKFVFFPCQTVAQQSAALAQPTVTYKGRTYDSPSIVRES